jgi:hypothetical protein
MLQDKVSRGLEPRGGQWAEPVSELMHSFATLLMRKFPSVEAAFDFIDINSNGILSMGEFVQGVRDLRFTGDSRALFKELDRDGGGTISPKEFKRLRALKPLKQVQGHLVEKTTREKVAERQSRSPIKRPAAHQMDTCLSSTAGFYTFERTALGRGDDLIHPMAVPGADPEIFSKERGPGAYDLKPQEVGEMSHPRRGNSFKVGGFTNCVGRFGPLMPSVQGAQDRALSAHHFATYAGQTPEDLWRVNGLGSHRLPLGVTRHGEPAPGHGSGTGRTFDNQMTRSAPSLR